MVMRLYDRIMREGIEILPEAVDVKTDEGESITDLLTRAFPAAVSVDLNNTVAYLASMSREQRDRVQIKRLPSVVPPFPLMFAEWDVASMRGWVNWEGATAQGFVQTGILAETRDWQRMGIPLFGGATDDEVRWTTTVLAFVATSRMIYGPVVSGALFLRPDGSSALRPDGRAASIWSPISSAAIKAAEEDASRFANYCRGFGLPVWLGCSLANCRNVRVQENMPRYVNRQDRRLAERNGDPPRQRFYTLEIDPARAPSEPSVRREGEPSPRALHICRGHFHTYSEDRPMFGKYAGTFWVPAHVRGKADVGVIGKDYRVLHD